MRVAAGRASETGWLLRLVRSGLLVAAALELAAAAHVSAGGDLPRSGGMLAIGAVATLVVFPFLGRPACYSRIVSLVVGGQFGFHLLLGAWAGRGSSPVPDALPPSGHGMHEAHGGGVLATTVHPDALTSGMAGVSAEPATADGLPMIAAHVAASVLVGLWLATGERLLWCCLRRIAAAVSRRWRAVAALVVATCDLPPVSLRPGPVFWRVRADVGFPDWLLRSPRRGPPRIAGV